MREVSLRNFLVGFAAAIVIGSIYLAFGQNASSSQTVTSTTSTVQRRTIVSSIKAVGNVTFASEQQLKFNLKGTVAKVLVQEGDTVKKGQVLAELDKVSALADVRQSQLTIAATQLQLEQLQADREHQVLTAQNNVAGAARTVEQSKLDLQKTSETEVQNMASTAQDILISSEKLLDSFYSILTRDSSARPTQDITTTFVVNNLLYRDIPLRQEVELAYLDAVRQSTAMRQAYGTDLMSEKDPAVVLHSLEDAEMLAGTIQKLAELSYSMMQGASTDSITFPVATLNTLRDSVSANRSTAAGLVTDASAAIANLQALSGQNRLPSVTLQEKQNTLTASQEDQLAQQATFQSTLADLDIAIRLKQNSISQNSVSLTKLYKALDDYRIVAPFEGVVRRVDFQVGDNLLADTTEAKYIVLENPNDIIITIPLDQVDVVRIKKDMAASITLDAIPGQAFQGKIHAINPTPVVTSGVVSYDVEIQLPAPKDLTILSGMTATVNVETMRKENVLAVPNLALSRSNGQTSVKLASGATAVVETGVTDGRFTEILSGVNEGDTVVSVNLASAQKSSVSTNPNQAFQNIGRLGGGGGRPGG